MSRVSEADDRLISVNFCNPVAKPAIEHANGRALIYYSLISVGDLDAAPSRRPRCDTLSGRFFSGHVTWVIARYVVQD